MRGEDGMEDNGGGGGGGSGGAVLLAAGGVVVNDGLVDVSGGDGGYAGQAFLSNAGGGEGMFIFVISTLSIPLPTNTPSTTSPYTPLTHLQPLLLVGGGGGRIAVYAESFTERQMGQRVANGGQCGVYKVVRFYFF